MTKKQNKIDMLYLPIYASEQASIGFKNGSSVRILEYINKNSLPCDLQNAIINQDAKQVIKLIRHYKKQVTNNKKHVNINYTCDVFSTVTNSSHFIKENLVSGFYDNLQIILQVVNKKRQVNNNKYVSNLKFNYKFSF